MHHIQSCASAPPLLLRNTSPTENTDLTNGPQSEQLIPKKNALSVIETCFGFREDDIEQDEIKCKHCRYIVSVAKGTTKNLFDQLKHK